MSERTDAPDLSFALTATPEKLPEGDDRPCAFCNPTQSVDERRYCIAQDYSADIDPEQLPSDAGIVKADYVLRFGHEDGAGVEVPACDMCLIDCPVEHDDQTTHSQMDFLYHGDGELRERVVEEDPETGRTVHRKVPVNGSK